MPAVESQLDSGAVGIAAVVCTVAVEWMVVYFVIEIEQLAAIEIVAEEGSHSLLLLRKALIWALGANKRKRWTITDNVK